MMYAPQPPSTWNLSAPESLVLLWGPQTGDTWTLSLAFLELAVRHNLRLQTVRRREFLFLKRECLFLVGQVPWDEPHPEPIAAVLAAYPFYKEFANGGLGFPVREASHLLFGPDALRKAKHPLQARPGNVFVRKHVMPGLQQRGLYTSGDPLLTPALTPEGKDRLLQLQSLIDTGRRLATGAAGIGPSRALEYVNAAGSALLLVRRLPTALRQLLNRDGSTRAGGQAFHTAAPVRSEDQGRVQLEPIAIDALLRPIGPGPEDDLDQALYAITTEIERQWALSYPRITLAAGTGE